MKKITILMLFLISLIGWNAFAYDAKGPWTKVDQIYTTTGNVIFAYFDAGSMPGCYGDHGGYIDPNGLEGRDRVYSVLVAALMADREVQVYYNYVNEDISSWSRCYVVSVYVR